MYFSGKITNSVIQYLNRLGIDIDRLFELTDLPTEFLCDPSCWLGTADVEAFLVVVEREFASKFNDSNLMVTAGHACHDLKAWGVLDGVLKMMQRPSDIYSQPQRFISYFVSPAPPIGDLQRDGDGISFDLPISNTEFPLATEYLRAALEALPVYVGKNMAQAVWQHTRLTVSWSDAQVSMLPSEDYVVKPELMKELVASLEVAQRELEAQKQIVVAQKQEIESLKATVPHNVEGKAVPAEVLSPDREQISVVRGHVMRLSDYIARAHQLITLLVKQDRLDRQVQEAMRRVDWDYISVQYREVVEEALRKLESLQNPEKPKKSVNKSARKRSAANLELSATP